MNEEELVRKTQEVNKMRRDLADEVVVPLEQIKRELMKENLLKKDTVKEVQYGFINTIRNVAESLNHSVAFNEYDAIDTKSDMLRMMLDNAMPFFPKEYEEKFQIAQKALHLLREAFKYI